MLEAILLRPFERLISAHRIDAAAAVGEAVGDVAEIGEPFVVGWLGRRRRGVGRALRTTAVRHRSAVVGCAAHSHPYAVGRRELLEFFDEQYQPQEVTKDDAFLLLQAAAGDVL